MKLEGLTAMSRLGADSLLLSADELGRWLCFPALSGGGEAVAPGFMEVERGGMGQWGLQWLPTWKIHRK